MITRTPEKFARDTYDLIIVGGGIYGACLSLEAGRRGLRSLLVERDDFGGATSWNSLRILHGGLRYLQSMDLSRFRESVSERRWFCQNFPELISPLPCVMPLYGKGLKRKAAFGPALMLNDLLSSGRNKGVADSVTLPGGRIIDPSATADTFRMVDREQLEGAGWWHDAVMLNSQRVLIEILRWSASLGSRALNYVEARDIIVESGTVTGIRALDRVANQPVEFKASTVINCAGPWSRSLAAAFDRDHESIFHPSLAFNIWVDREPLSQTALAVQPKRPGSPVYFMHPYRGGIFLGTIHAPWKRDVGHPHVDEELIDHLIDDVNLAIPDFNLKRSDIARIFSGLLPATGPGTDKISRRPAMHVHARTGGPKGLVTLCGVKFTTARLVAEKALGMANPAWRGLAYRPDSDRPDSVASLNLTAPEEFLNSSNAGASTEVSRIISEESVTCVSDLILRRTDWALNPKHWDSLVERTTQLHPELPLTATAESPEMTPVNSN